MTPVTERSEFDETRDRRRNQAVIASAMRELAGGVDGHVSYEDLAATVDRSADDVTREIVLSHAGACAMCAAELNDLRAFSGRGVRFSRRPIWLSVAAALVGVGLILAGLMTQSHGKTSTTSHPVVRSATVDEWQRAASAAMRTGRVDIPADIHALVAADAYRGADAGGGDHASVSPAGTVIDDLRPEFRWTPVAADWYEVEVYEGEQPFARSEELRDTAWVCPRPLVRGKTYRWQVAARLGKRSFIIPAPPAPPAVFRVLELQQHEALTWAIAAHSGDDLVLGVTYARFGMLDQALVHLHRAGAKSLAASIDFNR